MPPVVVVPSPECRNHEYRHAPAHNADIKDEMILALRANLLPTLYLLSSEFIWFE
jgi:hypothetical protein